jgi:hypothetical protein
MADFKREGVAVFAISYDPVPVLAGFAEKRGITYTLLSDEGSHAIRRLGLLNEHLEEQHAHYGVQTKEHHLGVPYPGTFVLDEDGVIVEKNFEQSYRVRPPAVSFLEDSFGQAGHEAVRDQTETEDIRVTAWLGTASYHPYQKLKLNLGIQVAEGLHVYGWPIPEGYTPLEVEIDPLETLEAGPLELPEPRPFRVEGLDEEFFVYEGSVRGARTLLLTKNLGEVTLGVKVHYQACSDVACFPPGEVSLQLPLKGLDNIRD